MAYIGGKVNTKKNSRFFFLAWLGKAFNFFQKKDVSSAGLRVQQTQTDLRKAKQRWYVAQKTGVWLCFPAFHRFPFDSVILVPCRCDTL